MSCSRTTRYWYICINNSNNNWASKAIQTIGAYRTASSGFVTADIAEIIHCTSVLSDSRLNDMHQYLSDRYGISITLL